MLLLFPIRSMWFGSHCFRSSNRISRHRSIGLHLFADRPFDLVGNDMERNVGFWHIIFSLSVYALQPASHLGCRWAEQSLHTTNVESVSAVPLERGKAFFSHFPDSTKPLLGAYIIPTWYLLLSSLHSPCPNFDCATLSAIILLMN